MIDRIDKGEVAVLVHPEFQQTDSASDLAEFEELVRSSGVTVTAVVSTTRHRPEPATCIGSGKVEELAAVIEQTGSNLVLFNHGLTPIQERNLEKALKTRVHDRTTLILDIFAQRARSHEGKLQVELAQLRHMSTRLVRGWTHLERQKGGIGLRGPGETQLETDRRLLGQRVRTLNKKLEKLDTQRAQGRRARKRNHMPVISLVGYTNAGKSTLFNRISGAEIYAADQLFATLDPTLRKIDNPHGRPFILADTVGFIQNLPHDLVAAFQSTLEEVREADLLLHVIDSADPEHAMRVQQVQQVIEEIDAASVPQILVYNKIDLTGQEATTTAGEGDAPSRAWVSAVADQGIEGLIRLISQLIDDDSRPYALRIGPDKGQLRARLYEWGVIQHETVADDGCWHVQAVLNARELSHACQLLGEESCQPMDMLQEQEQTNS